MGDNNRVLNYLALGDSYSVGEGIDPKDNFPNLLVKQLNTKGIPIVMDRLIAKTGWTTGEFIEAMEQKSWLEGEYYDCITLLIGVNNQYRGLSKQAYAEDLERIAVKCLGLVRGNADRVTVLSIPDWGVTPFAREKAVDPLQTSKSIDAFNELNKEIAVKSGFLFLDITEDYRKRGGMPECLAPDQLHPSAHIYRHWANLLAEMQEDKLQSP